MSFERADYSTRNLGIFVMIAAFAGVAAWLLVPALKGGSGPVSGNADAARPSSLALWLLGPKAPSRQAGLSSADVNAARSSILKVDGAVQIASHDDIVTRLVVPLAIRGDQNVAFTDDIGKVSAETSMSETGTAVIPATSTIT
jgi:hypothetical protein